MPGSWPLIPMGTQHGTRMRPSPYCTKARLSGRLWLATPTSPVGVAMAGLPHPEITFPRGWWSLVVGPPVQAHLTGGSSGREGGGVIWQPRPTPPPQHTQKHQKVFLKGRNENFQRYPKLEANLRYTNFFLASNPPIRPPPPPQGCQ